ncbi:hypothetical protein [Emcibacter sp. SYSU 3D8]|uniref:hypothetical protein n=1 Tax=Emcibacter sp. SYSU 3D8 TaxID=3133969 RepID=UPI0031FF3B30
MSNAIKWPLRAVAAALCILAVGAVPRPSTGQMPPVPQPIMSNPNEVGSAGDRTDKKPSPPPSTNDTSTNDTRANNESGASGASVPDNVARGSDSAAPVAVPFTAVADTSRPNRTTAAPAKKICPKKPQPIIVGSNGKVGSGARAKAKAISTLSGLAGGLLGGGGGSKGKGKGGPPLVKCKIKNKEMTVFTDPGTGISLKVGAKQAGDSVNVIAEVSKSRDNGTFQTAYMNPPGESPQAPQEVGICGLWGEWSLSVSWTKTTYVDGQKVSEESGGYSRAGNFNIPGTVSSDQAPAGLWKQLGFSNASHGAREILMRYRPPAALDAGQPVNMVIHVTRPGEDPVTTVPFNLLMTRTPKGFMFQQAPDEECPDDIGGTQTAVNDNGGAGEPQPQGEGGQGTSPPAGTGTAVAPGSPGSGTAGTGTTGAAGNASAAAKDPCEEHLRRARDRLKSRPKGGDDSLEAMRERASQEADIARGIAGDASRARYDLEDAERKAEDAQREADFRKGLYDKFGTHQKGQTSAYGDLADSARAMGADMEARAAEAERRAANWDEAAKRYDKIAETTDDPSLADAARQAADNAREDAGALRDTAADNRKQAKEDYDRAGQREQSGDRIQADTDKMEKDAQEAARAAADARALAECLKRAVAELDKMAAAQAQAAQAAAEELAQRPPDPPKESDDTPPGDGSTTGPSLPPASGPRSLPLATGSAQSSIAAVSAMGSCPWPTGKVSLHLVDADVYTPILYGTSDTFTDLADIVAQVKAKVAPHYDPQALCGKCLQQLDIWGHGDTGGGYISFGPNDAQIGKTPMGANFDQNLAALGGLMCVGGKVVINQCKAGTGTKGTDALQALSDKIGVTVAGPTDAIKGCRIFGGALTSYKEQTPGPNAKTPDKNEAGPVETE